MSRYRPPRPKSSPYITRRGYQNLQQELTHLWKHERPAVTRKVAEAAAQGDRSENAEYIYGKRQLRDIDRRIGFLSRRLDEVEVVDRLPGDRARVYFGAWVTLEDSLGEHRRYRIVGADEFDGDPDYISVDAPLARALIGKRLDDEITLETQQPAGTPRIIQRDLPAAAAHYVIVDIEYEEN